ncbi:hypothetical protein, partial [Pseudomonas sp. PS02303]|uniref:hypothetical protein n=1 Tax=Pseudomonas sp. PS02303 TaxID=2991429 RepID=UPI00249C6B8D
LAIALCHPTYYWMTHRYREQAHSYSCFGVSAKLLRGSTITLINHPVQLLFSRLDSVHSKKR